MTYNEIPQIRNTFGKYDPYGINPIIPIPVEEEQPEPEPEPEELPTEFTYSLLPLSYSGDDMWYTYINKDNFTGFDGYDDNQSVEAVFEVSIPDVSSDLIRLNGTIGWGEHSDVSNNLKFYVDTEGTDASYDNLLNYLQGSSIHGSGAAVCTIAYNDGADSNRVVFRFTDIQFIMD